MAEANEHASILIATSYQALNRLRSHQPETLICNCAVVIVFAAFFIEANLSHIIEKMGKTAELKKFAGRNPGLGNKMIWFYNAYVAKTKLGKNAFKGTSGKEKLHRAVAKKFPGFAKIYRFRNDLAHGVVNRDYQKAEKLRDQAKDIVNDLFQIADNKGFPIDRSVTYNIAITSKLKK